MKAFISLSRDGMEDVVFDAADAVRTCLHGHGFDVDTMLGMSDNDYARLRLFTLGDYMRHACAHIEKSDLVVCVVGGPRVGPGLAMEAGYALALGKPLLLVQHVSARPWLDELVPDRTVRFDRIEGLRLEMPVMLAELAPSPRT